VTVKTALIVSASKCAPATPEKSRIDGNTHEASGLFDERILSWFVRMIPI
jgi:hypothetical protein